VHYSDFNDFVDKGYLKSYILLQLRYVMMMLVVFFSFFTLCLRYLS